MTVIGRTGLGARPWSVRTGGKEQGVESQGLVFDRRSDAEITVTVRSVLDNDSELDGETVRGHGGVTRLQITAVRRSKGKTGFSCTPSAYCVPGTSKQFTKSFNPHYNLPDRPCFDSYK